MADGQHCLDLKHNLVLLRPNQRQVVTPALPVLCLHLCSDNQSITAVIETFPDD
jgi:hypothetical protein